MEVVEAEYQELKRGLESARQELASVATASLRANDLYQPTLQISFSKCVSIYNRLSSIDVRVAPTNFGFDYAS